MGTSTMGSEQHADKLAKLQARKKELEALLAAKNEDLYRVCVQELRLTGAMPPEAPSEPAPVPAETDRTEPVGRPRRNKDPPPGGEARHRLSAPTSVTDGGSGIVGSRTCPSLRSEAEAGPSRHHTLVSERGQRLQYSRDSGGRGFTRLQETHFSSSHPDISGRRTHAVLAPAPPQLHGGPLLYQYAAQLRARSPHLTSVQRPRRNTLQRTQTYHLTAHSQHSMSIPAHHSPLSPLSPLSALSLHSPPLSPQQREQEQRGKEKEWYESSLDSPSGSGGLNLSRESCQYRSPEPPVPISPLRPPPPPPPPPPAVPLESPKNCTVVESGKWIPYREVSKPFEMADFYKYSTKFRQTNNNNCINNNDVTVTSHKVRSVPVPHYPVSPEDSRRPPVEHWRHAHPLD